MPDAIYIFATVAFFATMLAFAHGVARLSGGIEGDPQNDNEPR